MVFIRYMADGRFHPGNEPMSESADWEALARYIAGESSAAESKAIEAGLVTYPADKTLIDALAAITRGMGAKTLPGLDVEAALLAVKARRDGANVLPLERSRKTSTGSQIRWKVLVPALAAAALLAVGVKSYFSSRAQSGRQPAAPSLSAPRTVATGVGVRDSLRLPDGTRVVIGPMSSVMIAADFGVERRDIEVNGDVWVDVVHNSSRPFLTHAAGATIQDLGTVFSVRTDEARGVAVSVRQGSVSLRSNTMPGTGVVLKSGEHGVLLSNGQVVTVPATSDDLAWMSGKLVFREASLADVATSLKRWYGIDLKVADPTLNTRHLTATFSTETPDRVLDVIRLALGAQIERRGDTAIVRATGGARLK